MQGRALSYIYSWLLALGVYFNIFIAWGQPDLHGTFSIGDKIADLVGLGQWRVEKRRFQNLRKKSAMPTSRADTPVQAGLLPEAIAAPFDAFAKAALDVLGEADASDKRPPLPELPEDPALPALKEQAREPELATHPSTEDKAAAPRNAPPPARVAGAPLEDMNELVSVRGLSRKGFSKRVGEMTPRNARVIKTVQEDQFIL
jgi:hypothetical protein